jgi:hypothetical protein
MRTLRPSVRRHLKRVALAPLALVALVPLNGLAAVTTWSPQTTGTTSGLNAVAFADVNNGVAVGNGGTVITTSDGGKTWTAQPSGVTADLRGLTNYGDSYWAAGTSGTIILSNDKGHTWCPQTSGTTVRLNGMLQAGPNDVFAVGDAVGDNGTVVRAAAGGAANPSLCTGVYSPQVTGTTNNLYSMINDPNGTFVATGASGTILNFNGTTWSTGTSGTTADLFGIAGTTPSATPTTYDDWVVGAGGVLLHSSNSTNFTAVASGTSADLYAVSFPAYSDTGFAVGSGGTIIATTNSGASWTPQTSGTSLTLLGLAMTDTTHGWASGLRGTMVHTPVAAVTTPPGMGIPVPAAGAATAVGSGSAVPLLLILCGLGLVTLVGGRLGRTHR